MDVNRASAGDLALLPGIGPSLAQRIVAYRDQHGPFPAPEALLAVRGIGQKTLQKLMPFLRFDSEEVEHATQSELSLEGGDAAVPRRGQARAHVEAHVPLARP
jgi:competence ComEA-like helix-hairpin-helix protein